MLEVHLLGRFEILLDGQPLDLPARPAQALLAYLVLNPGIAHRREQIAGLLWPDSDEANARRYLSQALWRLRKSLGDTYFHTDKLSLTFTPQPEDRLDVHLLAQPDAQASDAWMDSLAVYQGRLLPGFYEDWAWEQAEHFQALFERQAQTLLAWLVKEQRWKDVLEWGEHWLRWGETPEPAYRALMQAHAGLGDQAGVAAVYRRCVTALERDIGVEPSPETTTLYEQIRKGELKVDAPPPVEVPPTLPAFMTWDKPPPIPQPVFVARERVLEKLEGYLAQALDGRGQVAFVVGEAGQGKTSLLYEFLHRVQKTHPEILTAFGTCNAYAGTGDPYLPFRELMQMLTGDVESHWRAGQVPTAQARLLWRTLPQITEALLARGQNLIGTLVPGPSLLARAKAAGTEYSAIARLETLVARQTGMEGMQRDFLFEQTSNVLRQLAEAHPLILVLDDLHWADESSTALLFHLGRRLRESRILIMGAYRPEDVAHGHNGQPHPLQGVGRELQRLYGEIEVNLDEDSRAHHHRFVEAYLDTEPNRLGADFRQAFAHHTGGHPLFSVETIRDMQARGDIWQDESGQWVAGPELSWEALATRVEGVIANRISRLSTEAHELLTFASVEGEVFTAEVLAQVLQKDTRVLVRELSGPLARHHHLVREQGMVRLEGGSPQRLSQFRFRHHLFQSYLYSQLGAAERAYLHEDIGRALETLYVGRTAEVAVQLARHFREAGQVAQEIHYLRQAGERAAVQYANEEAVAHFSRALELLPEQDLEGQYAVLLAREKVYDLQGKRKTQYQDLAALQALAIDPSDDEKRAEVALLLGSYYENIADHPAALQAAQGAIRLAQTTENIHYMAEGYLLWGTVLWRQFDKTARTRVEQTLQFAKLGGDLKLEARCYRLLGNISAAIEADFDGATNYYERAMQIFCELGDRVEEGRVLNNLGNLYSSRDLSKANDFLQRSLQNAKETGDRVGELRILSNLGSCFQEQGTFTAAYTYLNQGLHISHELDNHPYLGSFLYGLGYLSHQLGDYDKAESLYRQAIQFYIIERNTNDYEEFLILGLLAMLAHDQGEFELGWSTFQKPMEWVRDNSSYAPDQGIAFTISGHLLSGLGRLTEASEAYRKACFIYKEHGLPPYLMTEPLSGLARLSMAQGEPENALGYVEEILAYLKKDQLYETYNPFRIYLTCYQVLQANQDPRAEPLLESTHALLMQHAGNISDERLHTSFLGNVVANRALLEEYQKLKTD